MPPALASGAPAAGATFFGSTLGMSLIGALVAILPAWVISEVASEVLTSDTTSPVASSAIWVAALGAVFGAIYSAWPDAIGRVWSRAGVALGLGAGLGLVGGAIAGATAQKVYEQLLGDYPSTVSLYVGRILAWAIFGLLMGAAVGAAQRVPKKALLGLAGGAFGGAIGGLLFEALAQALGQGLSDRVLRLVGVFFVLTLIGLSIGLVETGLRQAWVRVVAGGMTGKEFILYAAATDIGTSPKCQITLIKDPTVQPFHCRIQTEGHRRRLVPYQGAPVFVNSQPVVNHMLRSGDLVTLGQTTFQYADRA